MKVFKDATGRDWQIAITIGAIRDVRDLTEIDLGKLFLPDGPQLFDDCVKTVDVLYVLCRQQCSDRKMTDADFGGGFDGDTLEAASIALRDAVVDFFPQQRQKLLRALIQKNDDLKDQAMQKAMEQIEQIDPSKILMSSEKATESAAS